MKVMESHGKAICFHQKIKREKDKKFERITDESGTGFNFDRNKDKQSRILCIIILENMLVNYCFDTTVRTNA